MRTRKSNLLLVAILMLSVGCSSASSIGCRTASPNLSPRGTQAFYNTKVIKALDVMRDVVVLAAEQNPPLIQNNDMRTLVMWHQSAIMIIKTTSAGWQAVVKTSMHETVSNLPSDTQALVRPYVSLIEVLLAEVP